MNSRGRLVLADFGISSHVATMKNTSRGSLNYISPEVLAGEQNYTNKIDIW